MKSFTYDKNGIIILMLLIVSFAIFAQITDKPTILDIEVYTPTVDRVDTICINKSACDVSVGYILIKNTNELLLYDKAIESNVYFTGMIDYGAKIDLTEDGAMLGFGLIPRFIDTIEFKSTGNKSVLITKRPLLLVTNTKLLLTEDDWKKIIKLSKF